MTHRPNLSLCIPTFNRAHTLPALFDSIARQWRPGVEVVVADNASTDGTRELVRAFAKRMPKGSVVYTRAPVNRQFNANIIRVTSTATGYMAWIIGSDDVLAVGALARVLDTMQNVPGAIIVGDVQNISAVDGSKRKHESCTTWPDYSTFWLDEPGAVARYLSRAKTIHTCFPFISNIVFPRGEYPTAFPPAWAHLSYHHLYALWDMALRGVPVVTRRKILVCASSGFPERRDAETMFAALQSAITVFQLKRMFADPVDRAAVCKVWALEYPAWRMKSLEERCHKEPQWPYVKAALTRMLRGGTD